MRVLLIDDHPMFRLGVARFLAGEPGIEVVGEADDGIRGLNLARTAAWDVLVLDASLPTLGGFEVLRRLRADGHTGKVVVLSHYPVDPFAARALQHGADAYVCKSSDPERLLDALRAVTAGRTWVDGTEEDAPAPAGPLPHQRLSSREVQVLECLLHGRSNIETAAALDLSPSTVSNHVARIKEKLGVTSRAAILAYAHRAGLIG